MARHSMSGQRGFVFVATILSTVTLLSFCGLAIDVGYLFLVKTRMQTAADAAAIGGVQELRTNGSNGLVAAAKADSAVNGFTDGLKGVTVIVNRPPLSGYYTSDPTAVEVVVAQNSPTFFMQVLGFSSMRVSVRAVARQGAGSTCVYALNPTASKAVWTTGTTDFTSPCGIFVNSSNAKAVTLTGSANINTSPGETDIVGSYDAGSASIIPAPVTGVSRPAVVDPFAGRALPALPAACDYTNKSLSDTATLYPGVYCGGLSITGSGNVTFLPGLYIMNGGGFNIAGSGTAVGTGITVYITADGSHNYKGISINGSGVYSLSAPTSGDYESLLFIGERTRASNLGSTITGTTSLHIEGVVYLPKEELTFTGGSAAADYQILVSDTLRITGTSHLGNNFNNLRTGPPIRGAAVVSE